MKRVVLIASLALASAPALADSGMKAGLWEVHITKQIVDGKDMTAQMAASLAQMQQMLANMSPAQRKQMEQAMGGQAMPTGTLSSICISAEMAAQDKPIVSAESRCQPGKYARSGNKITFELSCPHASGKGENLIDGDTIHSKMDWVTTDAHGRHTTQSETQLKYLGSDCKGIKPVDQLAREMQQRRGQ